MWANVCRIVQNIPPFSQTDWILPRLEDFHVGLYYLKWYSIIPKQTVDPDQTGGAVWSGSTLFAFLLNILRNNFLNFFLQSLGKKKKYGINCLKF